MEQRTSLTEIIEYINPGDLNYQEWINVGMALKQEGYSMDCWDAWSRRTLSCRGMCKKMEKLLRLFFSCDRRDHRTDGIGSWMGSGTRP